MAFDIKLYQSTAENHRVDKTDYLALVGTISGTLREDTSVTEPIITISYTVFPKVNYAYIEEFGRYYFVGEIESISIGLWDLHLSVDVLMTYKEDILNSFAVVDRNEFKVTPMAIDNKRVVTNGEFIDTELLTNYVLGVTQPSYIITGVGLQAYE